MTRRNGLHTLTAAGSLLVGAFLALGGYGHFEAVLPALTDSDRSVSTAALIFPGALLVTSGLLCIALCKALWDGRRWALHVAIMINALALIYFAYLMHKDMPGHPVAMFTGVVACNLVLLVATRLGLVWPADGTASQNP